jgi:GGDEF domain-containing protein
MLLITLSALFVATVSSVTSYMMYQQVRGLRQQLVTTHTNSSVDCLTRTGVRATWQGQKRGLIFMDLDHMHRLNSLLGYEQVDALIKRALATIRSTDKVDTVGQWMSGDEFIIICPAGDEIGLATRLKGVMSEITAELALQPEVLAKHSELLATDARYGMSVPTFAATYGCVVTGKNSDLSMEVARATEKVQRAKAAGDRGAVNS